MDFRPVIEHWENCAQNQVRPDDFFRDGLCYCHACGQARQTKVEFQGVWHIMPVTCDCQKREDELEAAREQAQRAKLRAERLREAGFADGSLSRCRFEDAEMTPELQRCLNYAERWEDVRNANMGLLLWGAPGGGKTFAAACIANRLIDHGVSAVVTSFPRILNGGFDKSAVSNQLRRCSLAVMDDLGAERGTEYASELVYFAVDERYKAQKPLIVTTNLTLTDLRGGNMPMTQKRVYERILEMCVPLEFRPHDFRDKAAGNKFDLAKEIFR